MTKIVRKVIKIDEDLCNGCGKCVPSCAEGAIQIIDGKARLVADKYCDGLGACLGECPMGALSFEEREADVYDEHAVGNHPRGIGRTSANQAATVMHGGGCPGSRILDFRDSNEETTAGEAQRPRSELRQWPVKLSLLNPSATYLQEADLTLAADCSAFACASFHPDYLKGHVLAIGCPKFEDVRPWVDKLSMIIRAAGIKSVTVVHMEVPCCSGLIWAARKAIEASGRYIPFRDVTVSLHGEEK